MFYLLLNIEVKTLIAVLFWGNLTSVILILSYASHNLKDQRLSVYFSLAKVCQSVAYFCLFFRAAMPDLVSVNLGNSLLFTGFYLEAASMLIIIQQWSKKPFIVLTVILAAALLVFNGIEFVHPDSSIRIVVASTCVFFILVFPNVKMLTTKNISKFKRTVGIFYMLVTSLQLPRAFYALRNQDISIHTNSFIQSLTFISLVMLMVFGLSAYLLLLKEDADRIIESLAFTDSLTGLANRRSFLDVAQRHFHRRQRESKSLTLLFLDIDLFKAANDTYGHPFGDEVLVALADVIRKSLRVDDLSCRYGGEEFVLLLPRANMTQASRVTARLMGEVRQTAFERHPDFSFTVSIGVMGGIPKDTETFADFLEKADKALYLAKKNGRNRVEEYSDDLCIE
jgi:diguanylate cyclase (GGDEF)-like protein